MAKMCMAMGIGNGAMASQADSVVSGSVKPATSIDVPFQGKAYRGDELVELVRSWSNAGSLDESFVASTEEVVCKHPEWCG